MVILRQEGSRMYPGIKDPVDYKSGRQRGNRGNAGGVTRQHWEVQPSGRRPGLSIERSIGKGLFQKMPTGEALTRIPPPTDGTGPPAVTVGKDT